MPNQLEQAKAEIRNLNRQIGNLRTELAAAKAKPEPKPLSRSSIEAYVGIAIAVVLAVQPMTWWLRIPLFLILVGVVADFGWRSPFTFRWNEAAKGFICLLAAGWVGWAGFQNVINARNTERFPPNVMYMASWGAANPGGVTIYYNDKNGKGGHIQGEAASRVVVQGSEVEKFAKDYRLWAACLHLSGLLDPKDLPVSGSAIFDIDGPEISMKIPWSDRFQLEAINGQGGTNYVLMLIPKSVKSANFATIRDALNQGAVQLQIAGGPP